MVVSRTERTKQTGNQRNLFQKLRQRSLPDYRKDKQSELPPCFQADHKKLSMQYSHRKNRTTNSGKPRSLA